MPARSEQDNVLIGWDVAIAMDDGVVVRADVFRPIAQGRFPVLLTYGPYAKGPCLSEGLSERLGEHDRRSSCRGEAAYGCHCMLTSVRSMNHDCGEMKPFTLGLMARGLRSWTM